MGGKITIDSATLMNKGLEVIEAHWLFDLPYEQIDVIIHPQSTVHSLVEYVDGAIVAQLGMPDMRGPIAYALAYPERPALPFPRLNLVQAGPLTFEEPDHERFPCLKLAYQAGRTGGLMPTVLSAADDEAVAAFLRGELGFDGIPQTIESALAAYSGPSTVSPEGIEEADRWARDYTREVIVHRGTGN
jgi:1-deoxy-D-xylulose-5-phosphate reductoisomerase